MANVMIRQGPDGYVFYMPKRDIEDAIVAIEFDTQDKWGGEVRLKNGGLYYIDPQPAPPRFPYSVRARRIDGVE